MLALEADPAPDALRTLVADFGARLGVLPDELPHGARRMPVTRARAIVVSRAHERLGLPLAAIERTLGRSRGAGHRALQRARRFVSE